MAYAMTKQGSLDNCVTYEFICDTVTDMNAIENRYRTIGTVAIVLQGSGGLEVYIAGSDKQWNSLGAMGTGGSGSSTAGLSIHICGQNEISEGLPNINEPEENTIYLTPVEDSETGNLYEEYIYVNNNWEKFGNGGQIDLSTYALKSELPDISGKADKADTVLDTTLSRGRTDGITIGTGSFAFGNGVAASGDYSHAEGLSTSASGEESHAEGSSTTSSGACSHSEGWMTQASGAESHAEGYGSMATSSQSHAEGYYTQATGQYSHSEGCSSSNSSTLYGARGKADHAEGYNTLANSGSTSTYYGAHAEGKTTKATSSGAHSEGVSTTASGISSHAEGCNTQGTGSYSHAEGYSTDSTSSSYGARGKADHAEGYNTLANSGTVSSAYGAHSEGNQSKATANASHAEGYSSSASGRGSHSEGYQTTASNLASHAEGYNTTASGTYSHAGGGYTVASASNSYAEGCYSQATGLASHAEGFNTKAGTGGYNVGVHAFGRFNIGFDTREVTVTDDIAVDWEPHEIHRAGSCIIRYTNDGTTTYYVPHIDVPAYNDPSWDINQAFWHSYTLPSGTDPETIQEWDKDSLYPAFTVVKKTFADNVYYFQNHSEVTTTYIPLTSAPFYHTVQLNAPTDIWPSILEEVGNGVGSGASSPAGSRSNARTLDLSGNEYLMGDVFVRCNADSTGGTKLAKETDLDTKANKTDTVLLTTLSIGRKANTTVGTNSVALGDNVESSGAQSFATGSATQATGAQSHAEGLGGTFSIDNVSYTSKAGGTADHTEGYKCATSPSQPGNHAEGYQTRATGGAAHSEGQNTLASGGNSHAEGNGTKATSFQAHAEGNNTTASGFQTHAEGYETTASSNQAHAEGSHSTASGSCSHAEGAYTIASASDSHAEGNYTASSGESSHSEGDHTQATGKASHVSGMYNVADSYSNWPEWTSNTEYSVGDKVKVINSGGTVSGYVCKTANNDSTINYSKWTSLNGQMNYAEIIGNGTADDARSNARTLDWDGNEYLKGDIYVGCNADSTGGTKLPRIPTPPTTDGTYTLQVVVSSGTPTYSWV